MSTTVYPSYFWNNIQTFTSNFAPATPSTSKIGVTFFSKMPTFGDNDLFFSASADSAQYRSGDPLSVPPQTLQDLLDSPFWTPSQGGISNASWFASSSYSVTSSGAFRTIHLSGSPPQFPDCSAPDVSYNFVAVGAALFFMGTLSGKVNPLMALIHFDDELNVYKASPSSASPFVAPQTVVPTIFMLDNVLTYRNVNGGAEPAIGSFAVSTPYVGWESARETHISLYPQRVNMAANPSFETSGSPGNVWGWRSNATIAPTSMAHPVCPGPQPRNQYLQVSGGPSPKVVECLPFPTAIAQDVWWSLEAAVASKGPGQVRMGLVAWDDSAVYPTYQASDWQTINTGAAASAVSSFNIIKALIQLPDKASFSCFRLEYQGNVCFLDNVLVDNNAAQLGYFDGDWYDGIEGDYSWYGGLTGPNSYSLFYNDKLNINSLLFGYPESVAKEGLVSNLSTMTSAEMRTFNPTFAPSAVQVVFEETLSIREARDEWLALNPAPQYAAVLTNGNLKGYLFDPLTQFSITVHHGGEAEKWVPEGGKVVGHYDDVYLFNSTSTDTSLYVPVEDFVVGTSVNYKTHVSQVE